MTNHTLPEIEIAKEETLRSNQREQLITASINPYKHTFNRSHLIHNVIKLHQSIQAGESTNSSHTIAGRLIAKRGHGKALFGNIQDDSGTIQFYANINDIADHLFQQIEQFNIGDIIGIEGVAFCTRKGELSLRVANATLLTKSLHPLPEKFHGLQDKEKRYRQRYVDLIANPEVKKTFATRSKTVSFIRNFLNESGFMEVETPILQSVYGGAEARPFNTHHNELKQNLFLRISLELPLKRLIVGGFENIFEIGRVFRNEGISYKHNPEYTLLELYQAYADYNDMMRLTETLLSELVLKITGSHQLNYKDQSLSFTPPFAKFTLHEALKHFANVDANNLLEMNKKAREVQPELPDSTPKIELIKLIYDHFVEPKLISPTFITNHPWETSPLAKRDRNNPELVERFELIIHGMEIANAYSELNDPIEQEHRFKEQESARDHGAKETHPMDQDFVTALKYGMPPTGGLGIGIDRVVMLLTNENSIRDVLFFPHLKT